MFLLKVLWKIIKIAQKVWCTNAIMISENVGYKMFFNIKDYYLKTIMIATIVLLPVKVG